MKRFPLLCEGLAYYTQPHVLARLEERARMRRRVLVAALIGLIGACAPAPRVIEKPVLVPKVTRCADTAAPAWTPVPAPSVCAKGRLCYVTADGANLVDNIGRLRSWAAQVDALCGGAK